APPHVRRLRAREPSRALTVTTQTADTRVPRRPRRPRSPGGWAALAVALLALLLILVVPFVGAATDRVEGLLSSNTQVRVSSSATVLQRGERACVRGLYLPEGGRVVRVYPGFVSRRSPTLEFAVRGDRGEPTVRGRAEDFPTEQPLLVDLGPLPVSAAGTVCVRNRGPEGVSLADARGHFGEAAARPPIRIGILSGTRPRAVALIDDALERARLFKSGVVSPALIVILGLLVLVAVGVTLRLVLRDDGDAGPAEAPDRRDDVADVDTADAPAPTDEEGSS
ncbi:MAG: hypothetical protein AB7G37_09810, partial [Solirubrobacteraceae bacterium]